MVILCSLLTYKLFKKHRESDNSKDASLSTTLFLMAVVTFLEAFQLYLHIASCWFMVALIRSYVTRHAPADASSGGRDCVDPQPRKTSDCIYDTIISLVLRLKKPRPWEDKLGQYSLLQDFNATRRISYCIHYATLCLVDKAKMGRKRGKLLKLSTHVKQAVIDSLKGSNDSLTNGVRSLQTNKVHELLSWACEPSDGMVTHTILVWHVATTICKHKLGAARDKKEIAALSVEDSAVDTASSLSEYCAYLVAFAPDLLPDHSFDSESLLDTSIKEARNLLGGAKTMEKKCEILRNNISDTKSLEVVKEGARLAWQLMEEIQDKKLQWKVLSDFWAEMMLYIAPCNDAQARAHLEALARGGEFITHLWALLTHAGVLTRARTGSQAA